MTETAQQRAGWVRGGEAGTPSKEENGHGGGKTDRSLDLQTGDSVICRHKT